MKTIKLSDQPAIFFLIVFYFFSLAALAQKAPMRYGKIDKVDLEMKSYPLDTSAAAAILCNYGYFDAHQFQFTWDIRIKIFKKEGTYWGSQVFPVPSKSDVKGITFNLENGQIIESKLKSESIFKEWVTNDYSRIRVAMPNVKEGSVIDIEFTFYGLPSEWRFQEEIPVRWSELIIEPNRFLDFSSNFSGFEHLSEQSDTRWVSKNIPAFKREPYMNEISNYITKMDIEIKKAYNGYGVAVYYGTNSWDAVYTNLDNYERFGGVLSGAAMFLNATAKEIAGKYANPFEKIKAAVAATKKVKWNEQSSLFCSSPPLSSIYNKQIGNSADVNMILIQLLKKLDFTVYPLAISTRNNGFLPAFTPTINKFNYLLAYVVLKDKTYILDATEEFMPAGLLPERCMNLGGRLIAENKTNWVDIIPEKKTKKNIFYNLNLEPDNQLTGKIDYRRFDYEAFNFRKSYEKFNSQDEYLKNFENEHKGLSVVKCSIKNIDSIYMPVAEEYDVKIKNAVNAVGNLLYINPMMYLRMEENPFKIEVRKYPVDFIYPIETSYTLKLTIPDGYKVSQLPKPLSIKLPDNSASCLYQIATTGNIVQLSYKYQINKAIFGESQYADLRAFFTEVVKKHAELIVLTTDK